MLSPEYLRQITEGSEQIAEELHQYIVGEIVSRMMTSARFWRNLSNLSEYSFGSSIPILLIMHCSPFWSTLTLWHIWSHL